MSIKLPIASMVMPSTLKGVQNGKLPNNLLEEIGVGKARMEKTAARSMRAMLASARNAGFNPRQVGEYRNFEQQLSLFLSRYQPVSQASYAVTPASRRKVWEQASAHGYSSKYWVKKKMPNGSYPATAATPGNSNHGWGLAMDIAEELDGDMAPEPISNGFVRWLVEYARYFGFSAELQSEPWHWRYVAGDRIPEATLDFEAGRPFNPVSPSNPGPAVVFSYPGTPLVLGSKGDAVKLVQAKVGATQDGDFGPATERRVKAWQKIHGLKEDGIVGSVTWKKMFG